MHMCLPRLRLQCLDIHALREIFVVELLCYSKSLTLPLHGVSLDSRLPLVRVCNPLFPPLQQLEFLLLVQAPQQTLKIHGRSRKIVFLQHSAPKFIR